MKSNSISIKLQGGWYYSLCTSASRPRPPIKAYFNWGKSFYGSPVGAGVEILRNIGTHHGDSDVAHVW